MIAVARVVEGEQRAEVARLTGQDGHGVGECDDRPIGGRSAQLRQLGAGDTRSAGQIAVAQPRGGHAKLKDLVRHVADVRALKIEAGRWRAVQ